jgi:hypothetical protein
LKGDISDKIRDETKASLEVCYAFNNFLHDYANAKPAQDEELVDAIVKGELWAEIYDKTFWGINDLRNRQQDAAGYLGVLLDQLGVTFQTGVYKTSKVDEKLVTIGRPDPVSLIMIELGEVKANATLYFQDLVKNQFSEKYVCDPSNSTKFETEIKTEWVEHFKIEGEPPSFMALQMKRRMYQKAIGEFSYLTNPIIIPDDDSIDFSIAFGKEQGSVRYKLTGFLYHNGNQQSANTSGHYVAYVRKGENYYYCSDRIINTISKKEFDSYKEKAYALLMDKE